MEFIKHLFGLCGESHLNIFTIIITLIILKISYEKYFSKTIWRGRR
jgi:hypothetical protein